MLAVFNTQTDWSNKLIGMLEGKFHKCFGVHVIWEVASTMSSSTSKRGDLEPGRKKLEKVHSTQFGIWISKDMLHVAKVQCTSVVRSCMRMVRTSLRLNSFCFHATVLLIL